MNILFISPNSPKESVGGIERYITNLINFYKNRSGCKIYLMLPTTQKSRTEKEGNVTIYYESNFSIPWEAVHNQKEIAKNARLFSALVGNIVKDKKIDIICAENIIFGPPAVYSLLLNMAASIHNIPLVLRLHSFAVTDLQVELINQLMWSKISCVSQSVTGDCFQKGTDIDILSTHYLGVDTHVFGDEKDLNNTLRKQLEIDEDSRIILAATRIIRGKKNIIQEKGLINLIQAFSKLSPRYPKLKLLIAIGKPPDSLNHEFTVAYEMLQGYSKLHNVEGKIILKMFKLNEMPNVYKGSDIFVLASENETFGQVFIEAMSCGTPVIGTKVGGIPEIISDSYNGYLVTPDDPSILAQRIEKVLNDESVRNKFIKAGLNTVKRSFTSEKQFSDFQEMLEKVVTDNH